MRQSLEFQSHLIKGDLPAKQIAQERVYKVAAFIFQDYLPVIAIGLIGPMRIESLIALHCQGDPTIDYLLVLLLSLGFALLSCNLLQVAVPQIL